MKKKRDYDDYPAQSVIESGLAANAPAVDEVPDGWEKILTYCPTNGNVFRLRQIRPHRIKKTDE